MTETETPTQDTDSGGSERQENFQTSFLVEEEGEISGIKNTHLRRRIRALHVTARTDPNGKIFSKEEWRSEYLSINSRMIRSKDDEELYNPDETEPFLERISSYLEKLDEANLSTQSDIQRDEWGTPEVSERWRSFSEIKQDLIFFDNNPDARVTSDGKTLAEVHREHLQLAQTAKEVGVFDGIQGKFEGIKTAVNETQEICRGDFMEAYRQVVALNSQQFENEASRHIHGWNDKFNGLIGAYRRAVLANMGVAWETAKGTPDSSIGKSFERHARVWNYDAPPVDKIGALAEAHASLAQQRQALERRQTGASELDLNGLLQGFREIFEDANVPPAEQREQFLEIEEYGAGEITVPLTASVIFKDLSLEDKTFWQARMALSNARSLRQAANSPEDLFPNDHIQKMTKEQLAALDKRPGVVEAESIYLIMVTTNDCRQLDGPGGSFGELFRDTKVIREKKVGGKNQLYTTDIRNLHEIRSEDELDEFRKKFRGYIQERFGLTQEQARDAELIGFNKFVMSDINEFASSADFERNRNGTPSRERPKTPMVLDVLISPAQRDLIHPLEKALDDNRAKKASDSWPPNELGNFIVAHPDYGPDKIPLPYTLTKKAQSFYHDFDIVQANGQETTLYKQMREDGLNLIRGRIQRARRINWKSVQGDKPYLGYYLTKNKQLFVWNVINTGGLPRDKSMTDLKNKLNALDIGDDFREVLAYLVEDTARAKLEPTKAEFKPRWGATDLKASESAFWDKFITRHPGYFRTKHTKKSLAGRLLGA